MLNSKKFAGFFVFAAILALSAGCGDKGSSITDPTSPAPSISSISPDEGAIGTELTVTGANFESTSSAAIGGTNATEVEFSSSTTLYVQVPSGLEGNIPLDVTVSNPDGQDATLENAFTAIDPELNFVNSATKPSGNIGSTVILEGRAFGDQQGDSQVFFSDGAGGAIPATISSPDDWTDSFIVTTVPDGTEDGPVYIETEIGISDSLSFTVTDAATFSPSAIEWTVTTSLPAAVSGHQAVYTPLLNAIDETEQYVVVTGGRTSDGISLDQTLSGRIDANGDIVSWNETTPLPDSLSFHATVSATPFNSRVTSSGAGAVYALGGVDNNGDPVSSVSIATLENDASISGWRSGTPLPEPLHSLGAVIFRSTIYIAGGATTDNVPVAKVYKAEIDTTGDIGTWQELPSLPSARSYHGFLSFGGYLYSVGGESAAVAPDGTSQDLIPEVAYARVNLRTGELMNSSWTVNADELQKSRSKHTAVTAGGTIFVSSGLYSAAGQGSSENVFAQINSDGSVGTFNGATGSNTLQSEGGINLFNQAGLSYVDENGVAHVMIIGGDNVNDPGTKTSNVLFY